MTIELGKLTLERLTHVSVRENARIARYDVPGMSGSLTQTLGRRSVEVEFRGIFYAETAGQELNALREAFQSNEPLDFFTEALGEGYFSQVLITNLEVLQRAGWLDQFDFNCTVVEYVEPPEPVTIDPFSALDADLLNQATAFVDDVQDALQEVSNLTDLIANAPSFGDPTRRLNELPNGYVELISGNTGLLTGLRDEF